MDDREMGDEAPSQPEGFSGIGRALPEQGTINPEAAGEIRRDGRLVNLRRGRDGGYQILMRNRVIQGFCAEFEDITAWRQPVDTQLQARISIVPTGRLRAAQYPDQDPIGGYETVQTRIMPDDGIHLESIAHPVGSLPQWQVNALGHLEEEVARIRNMIDMIQNFR